jgi:flagella basal body P-ring formation protein FlgA
MMGQVFFNKLRSFAVQIGAILCWSLCSAQGAAEEAPQLIAPDLEMAPQVSMAATLRFHSVVDVDGDRLFLGKLATCTGIHQVCDEVYGIDVGPSPEAGRTVAWHPDRVRAILKKEWPNADIRLAGAKVVKVTASSVPLTEERVESVLKGLLSEAYAEDDALSAIVDRVMLPPGLKLRPGEYAIEFPELSKEHLEDPDWVIRNLSGNVRLKFNCRPQDDDGAVTSYSAATHITVSALIPVTAKALAKGVNITPEDIKTEMRPITRGGHQFVASTSDLIQHRLRRPLPSGTPLLASDVELPRLVHRGQMVTLMMNEGDVAVSGSVKVMADGITGQVIEAQFPATKKKMRVRVIDAHTVQHVF